MNFWIQIGNPTFNIAEGTLVNDLAEAIQTIFPMRTEDAIIVWNHIYIPCGYKYDLSILVDDIVPMLSALLTNAEGTQQIFFGSDTFNVEWQLKWINGNLTINAKWGSVVCDIDSVKRFCSELEISVQDFLCEWNSILKFIVKVVKESKIRIRDRVLYDAIIKWSSSISKEGYLYSHTLDDSPEGNGARGNVE